MTKRPSPSPSPASEAGSGAWGALLKKENCAWKEGPAEVSLRASCVVVGRAKEDDISLTITLPAISTRHCKIEPALPLADGTLTAKLTDMSTNGTFVDGVRVGKNNACIVVDGSTLSFGKLTVQKPGKKKKKLKNGKSGKHKIETWIIPQFTLRLHEHAKSKTPQKRPRLSPDRDSRPSANAMSPSSNGSFVSASSLSTSMSARLQRANDELRQRLEAVRTREALLQNQLKEVTQKLLEASAATPGSSHKDDVAELNKRIQALEASLSQANGLSKAHKEEVERQLSRAEKAERALEFEKEKSAEAIKSKEMLAEEIKNTAAQAREDAELREKETTAVLKARKEAKDARLRCNELEATVEELKETKASLEATAERANQEALCTSVTLQSYKEANEAASAKASKLRDHVAELTNACAVKDKSVSVLKDKVLEHENALKKLHENLNETLLAKDTAIDTLTNVKRELLDKNERLKEVISELESSKQEIASLEEREEIARHHLQDVRKKIEHSVGPLLELVDDLKRGADSSRSFSQKSDLAANPSSQGIPLLRGFTGGGGEEHNEGESIFVLGLSQKSSVCATQAQCEEEDDDDGDDSEGGTYQGLGNGPAGEISTGKEDVAKEDESCNGQGMMEQGNQHVSVDVPAEHGKHVAIPNENEQHDTIMEDDKDDEAEAEAEDISQELC